MTTRPGYIWSGTEWVAIGQEAVVAPISYQTSAPSSPSTGDIWIDSNDDVPGIDTSQFLRWRKTVSGGETSVSGTDDTGLTLAYTAGYEQVYLNGVLLVRGQDYTATNGTSITGLTALAASDVVEVFGVVARVVGDTYTQSQITTFLDAKSPVSTTGLVLLNTTNVSAAASSTISNVFSSSYQNYKVEIALSAVSATANLQMQFATGGTASTTAYYYGGVSANEGGGGNYFGGANQSSVLYLIQYNSSYGTLNASSIDIFDPFNATQTKYTYQSFGVNSTPQGQYLTAGGHHYVATSYDGIKFSASSGTFTGTIKVYGYK